MAASSVYGGMYGGLAASMRRGGSSGGSGPFISDPQSNYASPDNPLRSPYEYQRAPSSSGRQPPGAYQPDLKANVGSPGNPLVTYHEYQRAPAPYSRQPVGAYQPDAKANIASLGNPLATGHEYQRTPPSVLQHQAGAYQPDARSNVASPGNPLSTRYECQQRSRPSTPQRIVHQPDPTFNLASADNRGWEYQAPPSPPGHQPPGSTHHNSPHASANSPRVTAPQARQDYQRGSPSPSSRSSTVLQYDPRAYEVRPESPCPASRHDPSSTRHIIPVTMRGVSGLSTGQDSERGASDLHAPMHRDNQSGANSRQSAVRSSSRGAAAGRTPAQVTPAASFLSGQGTVSVRSINHDNGSSGGSGERGQQQQQQHSSAAYSGGPTSIPVRISGVGGRVCGSGCGQYSPQGTAAAPWPTTSNGAAQHGVVVSRTAAAAAALAAAARTVQGGGLLGSFGQGSSPSNRPSVGSAFAHHSHSPFSPKQFVRSASPMSPSSGFNGTITLVRSVSAGGSGRAPSLQRKSSLASPMRAERGPVRRVSFKLDDPVPDFVGH